MKVLVVCQYYYPEPFRITDICEALARKGHQVTVLTGLPNYPGGRVLDGYRRGKKRNETVNGVKIIRTLETGRGRNRFRLFCNYLSFTVSASIRALFLKEKHDAVFVYQLSPVMMGIPAILYKKRHKKRMLLYCLDLWPDSLAAGGIGERSLIYKVMLLLSRWIYRSADLIMVSSAMFRSYFEKVLTLPEAKIEHLPQYAEDVFTEGTAAPAKAGAGFNFVFAGNIGEMQSVETIVKAAKEVCARRDIAFHIVGDGSHLEECRRLAGGYGLDNVKFYGGRPVEEMPRFYNMADAMLVTLKDNEALSYTLPGKMQSYMAAGKPVIGAINGEAERVIKEAGCGLCCRAEDHRGLADLLLQFCSSGEKQKMGANARDYYINHFSKEHFISCLEGKLEQLGAVEHV